MQHTKIISSTIASVGYEPSTRTLEIAFQNGSLYEYSNVPESVFKGLLNAASAGKYFDQNVKKAGFPFRQLK